MKPKTFTKSKNLFFCCFIKFASVGLHYSQNYNKCCHVKEHCSICGQDMGLCEEGGTLYEHSVRQPPRSILSSQIQAGFK